MYRHMVLPVVLITLLGCAPSRNAGERAVSGRVFAYDCGSVTAVIEYARAETARLFLAGAVVPLTEAVAASGARYAGQDYVFWSQGDLARLDIPGQDALDCRLDRLATPWQDARLRGVEFRAVGNEPGWLMEVSAREIFLALDYGDRQLRFPRPQPVQEVDAEGSVYRVEDAGQKLEVRITGSPCQDSMADHVYPASVTVTLADRQYFGCGRKLAPVASWVPATGVQVAPHPAIPCRG